MRILYATQKTGNGHLARAQELVPLLRKHAKVDVLVSGSQSQFPWDESYQYDFPGISLFYSGSGGLDYGQILTKNRWGTFLRCLTSLKLPDYDLIINDYEPITARVAQKRGYPLVGCSHQAALFFSGVPQPENRPYLPMEIIRRYAPVPTALGLHFHPWHPQLYPPIIRTKIKQLKPHSKGPFLAYLPAYSDDFLLRLLEKTFASWCIFSKTIQQPRQVDRLTLIPIDDSTFLSALESAPGVLCQAGFELPAETLFLKKKLAVIPIKGQLEQHFNAAALKSLGISVFSTLDREALIDWMFRVETPEINFSDQSETLVQHLLSFAHA